MVSWFQKIPCATAYGTVHTYEPVPPNTLHRRALFPLPFIPFFFPLAAALLPSFFRCLMFYGYACTMVVCSLRRQRQLLASLDQVPDCICCTHFAPCHQSTARFASIYNPPPTRTRTFTTHTFLPTHVSHKVQAQEYHTATREANIQRTWFLFFRTARVNVTELLQQVLHGLKRKCVSIYRDGPTEGACV
jgi:hypothetical protein